MIKQLMRNAFFQSFPLRTRTNNPTYSSTEENVNNPNEKKFSCEFKALKSQQSLKNHLKLHAK